MQRYICCIFAHMQDLKHKFSFAQTAILIEEMKIGKQEWEKREWESETCNGTNMHFHYKGLWIGAIFGAVFDAIFSTENIW